jgi:hypothetical protein
MRPCSRIDAHRAAQPQLKRDVTTLLSVKQQQMQSERERLVNGGTAPFPLNNGKNDWEKSSNGLGSPPAIHLAGFPLVSSAFTATARPEPMLTAELSVAEAKVPVLLAESCVGPRHRAC